MSSWVRYCVAVYVGLLISGALARPSWTYPAQDSPATARTWPVPDRDAWPEPDPDAHRQVGPVAKPCDTQASDTLSR